MEKYAKYHNKQLSLKDNESDLEHFRDPDISSDNEDSDEQENKSEKLKIENISASSDSETLNYKTIIITCVLVVALGVFITHYFPMLYKTFNNKFLSYSDIFNELKYQFPSQSVLSWKILNNSLSNQIHKTINLDKPSVIILVGSQKKIELFQKSIIRLLISSSMNPECPFYEISSDMMDKDDLRLIFRVSLEKWREQGIRCVYIPNIDKIPPYLGPSLQGLTDEFNAPFKEMIYMFSLAVNRDINKSILSDKNAEKILVEILRTNWEPFMGVERFEALITRLCVNVVAVQ